MKKVLSTILMPGLLTPVLPTGARAAAGHMLTESALAAARALTGVGVDRTQSNTAYHKGMIPDTIHLK